MKVKDKEGNKKDVKYRKYVRPDIKEVWDESVGTTGVFLLEM